MTIKKSKMIDFENIHRQMEGIAVSREASMKAFNDFEAVVKLTKLLPVFEDTGEIFVHNRNIAWGVFQGCFVEFVTICHNIHKTTQGWEASNPFHDSKTTKFYSTKEAAEIAKKGHKQC